MRSFGSLYSTLFLAASLLLVACARVESPEATPAPAAPPVPLAEAPAEAHRAPHGATPEAIKPLDKKKFGAAITEKVATPLDALLKEPARYGSSVVRTEGVVSAVCKQRGCWMELADDQGRAHVKMAGHAFFVPKESPGHHAIVQGRVLPVDKDECTEEAQQQTGQVATLEIEATGIEFVD